MTATKFKAVRENGQWVVAEFERSTGAYLGTVEEGFDCQGSAECWAEQIQDAMEAEAEEV